MAMVVVVELELVVVVVVVVVEEEEVVVVVVAVLLAAEYLYVNITPSISPALSSSVMRSHTAAGDISGAACCTGWSSLFPAAAALGCGGCSAAALWEVNRPACRRSALPKPRKRPNIRLRNWSGGAVIRHMKRQ